MPNFTTNLNLEKPLSNENYNIEVFNENADKLDTAIKEVSSKVDNFEAPVKSVNGKTGAVTLAAADIKTVDGKTLEQFKVDASSQLDTKANETDETRLTENKTVTGAINELFTSASNGKTLVANAVTNKGVEASVDDTFTLLADKIGQISTGKKFASGIHQRTSATDSRAKITVRGLDFKPRMIVLTYIYTAVDYTVSQYITTFDQSSVDKMGGKYYSYTSYSEDSYPYYAGTDAIIYDDGFHLTAYLGNGDNYWVAFE